MEEVDTALVLHPASEPKSTKLTPPLSNMCATRSEPRLNTSRVVSIKPLVAPTYHSRNTISVAPVRPVSSNWASPMLHLNADGYPTRALYYLHKRLLDVTTKSRHFVLTTPPLSPLFSPPEPNNSLDLDDNVSEQTQVLEHLCATIISRDYVRPPTPPVGQSPYCTPPQFDFCPQPVQHDETASRVARLLVHSNGCDIQDVDMLDMFQVELELEIEMENVTPKPDNKENCPANKKTLFDEMEDAMTPKIVKVPTPEEQRKARQANRRARNSLNGSRDLTVLRDCAGL